MDYFQLQPHPKIKPIPLQRFASGKNQNEKRIRKYSISSSKEFKIQDNSQINKRFVKTLASQHQLSKLEYTFSIPLLRISPRFPTSFIYFFSKIRNLSSLKTFTLQLYGANQFLFQSCLTS